MSPISKNLQPLCAPISSFATCDLVAKVDVVVPIKTCLEPEPVFPSSPSLEVDKPGVPYLSSQLSPQPVLSPILSPLPHSPSLLLLLALPIGSNGNRKVTCPR